MATVYAKPAGENITVSYKQVEHVTFAEHYLRFTFVSDADGNTRDCVLPYAANNSIEIKW